MHSILAIVVLAAFVQSTPAQSFPTPHSQVGLIAEDKSIAPGRDFWVGLHFQLEKGWHIYWVNPGDSGEPVKVQWTLPAGFTAGPIEWPAPKRLEHSSIVDYGYEDDAVPLIKILSARTATHGTTARFDAVVKWLVCREICIPMKSNLYVLLPVAEETPQRDEETASLFAATRAHLPKPLPESWSARAFSKGDAFILTLYAGKSEPSAQFFPLEAGQIENAARQEEHSVPGGVALKLAKSSQLLKPIVRLRGVIVLAGGKAYQVDAPVQAQ